MAVLKANHLTTAKAVAKKAQTIMKQADADGSGTLTMDEFLVVAKKFPNLVSTCATQTCIRGVGRTKASAATRMGIAGCCCAGGNYVCPG